MSLDSVKNRVLQEAGAKADARRGEARAQAGRILAEGRVADERVGSDTIHDTKLRLERETTRELESLQHDNRLQILSAKNKAIDEVFRRVHRKLAELPERDYLDLVGSWLGALPAGVGGMLRVNPRDVDKFTAALAGFNRTRSGDGMFIGVTGDSKVPNGAVVDGRDYAVDCTVARRLLELRDASAGDVARVLFGV